MSECQKCQKSDMVDDFYEGAGIFCMRCSEVTEDTIKQGNQEESSLFAKEIVSRPAKKVKDDFCLK